MAPAEAARRRRERRRIGSGETSAAGKRAQRKERQRGSGREAAARLGARRRGDRAGEQRLKAVAATRGEEGLVKSDKADDADVEVKDDLTSLWLLRR